MQYSSNIDSSVSLMETSAPGQTLLTLNKMETILLSPGYIVTEFM